ncbi:helix-turn-helix domain-containing protein [Tolumonas osonensis]|uniref:AraC-like DNA-binding protein n=1 Tax=Tolumonas osonensis TaxID=675874 RepID=A0A841GJK1_9GAMM|nr:helix-turn-helix transcriptional regulator [Tolumonas osonensis]MBB6055010.1 AraC-like DNA-binding protein [Tolumonas osonensis]
MIKSISNLIIAKTNSALYDAGLNTSELLKKSGISDYEIETPGVRLSENQYYSFIDHGSQYLETWSEKTIEFITSQNSIDFSYALFPQLASLCLNEKSAYDALLAYINHRVIIGNVEEIIVSVKPDETKIEIIDFSPNKINMSSLIGVLVYLYSLVKMYHADAEIKTGLATNKHKDLLVSFFGGNCIFNQDSNYIIVKNQHLFSKNSNFNPFLYKYQKAEIERETTSLLSKSSFMDMVIVLIEKAMAARDIETENSILEYVCNHLRISRWTLNQKLKFEDMNFSLLLRKVRLKKACEMLSTTNMNMQEVSDSLLFSSQSVFSRFFSSNIGESPVSFRKKHRGI